MTANEMIKEICDHYRYNGCLPCPLEESNACSQDNMNIYAITREYNKIANKPIPVIIMLEKICHDWSSHCQICPMNETDACKDDNYKLSEYADIIIKEYNRLPCYKEDV